MTAPSSTVAARVFEGTVGHEIIGGDPDPWWEMQELFDGLYGKRVRITVEVIETSAAEGEESK